MSKLSDPKHLLANQYQNSSNLNARLNLHERFSTNKYGWHLWVFDQFNLPPESRILELGCGPGALWSKNIHRIPDGWDITLSDFSPGMLRDAQQNLRDSQRDFEFREIDAQSIPFAEKSFDAVIANHMLYHVQDRDKALSEIHRVLKPGGCLYAATNGQDHLRELEELLKSFDPDTTFKSWDNPFSLENAGAQISRWFSRVSLFRYEDSLAVTEVEPLVAYIMSMNDAKEILVGHKLTEFADFLEREMTSHDGVISITKTPGMFEARL